MRHEVTELEQMDSGLIRSIFIKVAVLHDGQKRKGRGLPFIVHPFGVFLVLIEYTNNSAVLGASLAHDVFRGIRDYSYDQLFNDFGEDIAQIVKEVGEDFSKKSWRERKYGPLERFSEMKENTKWVYVAEVIDNLEALVRDYASRNEKIWEKFNADEEMIANYYRDVFIAVTSCFHQPIVARYHQVYQTAINTFHWEKRFFEK